MTDIKRLSERRRARRSSVLLSAVVNCDDTSRPVRLINLSAGGSTVESRVLGGKGDWVELRRNGLALSSQIIWVEDGRSGVRFEPAIDIDRLLRRSPKPRVEPKPACWRPGVSSEQLTAAEQESFVWWANRLGLDPAASETTVRRTVPPKPGRTRR
jgi:hypothetical protein